MNAELTMDRIAPYLPYGLMVKWNIDMPSKKYNKTITLTGIELIDGEVWGHDRKAKYSLSESCLILRPLSQLTEKIDHNGVEIVPIEELTELYCNTPNWRDFNQFWVTDGTDLSETTIEYCVLRQLCEWHFDVFGLIDLGVAVPIVNRLKLNETGSN